MVARSLLKKFNCDNSKLASARWLTWAQKYAKYEIILIVFISSVCLRAVGGEVGATSSLAPKVGPLGLVSEFPLPVFSVFTLNVESIHD